jgi:predicted DNA-binding transcriptional regulator YafY
MFKVSRIIGAERTGEVRRGEKADLEARPWLREWNGGPMEKIILETDAAARAKLAEFFDPDCIAETGCGRYRVTAFLPVDEWIVSFIMGLPGNVDIAEPDTLRSEVAERARRFIGHNKY